MQSIEFNYFRGIEAEQHTFYRVPKILFTGECFKALSCEAKVLYGLMLDRMSLSIKNRWLDDEDRAYIIFTVDEVMELLNCSRQKAVKNMAELNNIGLTEKKRLGLGKPNVIYVKNFVVKETEEEIVDGMPRIIEKYENCTSANAENESQEVPESDFLKYENHTLESMKNESREVPELYFKKSENHTSASMKTILPEIPKPYSNNTDINKTDSNETNPINHSDSRHQDMIEETEIYREIVRDNISYPCFVADKFYSLEQVDELVELIVEVMLLSNKVPVRIAGAEMQAALVKNRFMKLEKQHIEYILGCLQQNTSKVTNIKAYLLTALYNAPATMENYYQSRVNYDMYGGG